MTMGGQFRLLYNQSAASSLSPRAEPSGRGRTACGRWPSGQGRSQMLDKSEGLSYRIFAIGIDSQEECNYLP